MQVELNKIQVALAAAHGQLDERLRVEKDSADKSHAKKCGRIARERANAKARLYDALSDSLGVKISASAPIWPTPDGRFMIELPDPPKAEAPALKVLEPEAAPKNGSVEPAAT